VNAAVGPLGISPAGVDLGRWVYSAWKHLRTFDQRAITSFEATSLAGRACDLLGRMRLLVAYSPSALRPLYSDAGITRSEFSNILLPLLEGLGIFQVTRYPDNRVYSIQAVVLSQADVMATPGTLGVTAFPGCLVLRVPCRSWRFIHAPCSLCEIYPERRHVYMKNGLFRERM
jgi:hypothetical protein